MTLAGAGGLPWAWQGQGDLAQWLAFVSFS